MPNMQEITDTIDRRIVELRGEIDSLEAARRALTEIRTVRPNGGTDAKPAAAERTPTKARRPRRAKPAAVAPAAVKPAAAKPAAVKPALANAAALEPGAVKAAPVKAAPVKPAAVKAAAPTRSKSTRPAAPSTANAQPAKPSPTKRRRDLEAGEVEGLLRESADGLSLAALVRHTGVSETKVADRLQTLARTGEARSSGKRRTSLWRLVSDEERIAERAAELARASRAKA
jgi:hypothetical protein